MRPGGSHSFRGLRSSWRCSRATCSGKAFVIDSIPVRLGQEPEAVEEDLAGKGTFRTAQPPLPRIPQPAARWGGGARPCHTFDIRSHSDPFRALPLPQARRLLTL